MDGDARPRRGNPETGIVVGLLDDGRRALGHARPTPGTVKALATEDLAGRRATLRPDGAFDLA